MLVPPPFARTLYAIVKAIFTIRTNLASSAEIVKVRFTISGAYARSSSFRTRPVCNSESDFHYSHQFG